MTAVPMHRVVQLSTFINWRLAEQGELMPALCRESAYGNDTRRYRVTFRILVICTVKENFRVDVKDQSKPEEIADGQVYPLIQ